jgi:hypothetical protein
MAKTITVTLDDNPKKLIEQAKEAASQNGIIFEGDHESGNYSGFGLEGEYQIQDRELTLNIIKKPAFLPWNMIETKIKQFFEQ